MSELIQLSSLDSIPLGDILSRPPSSRPKDRVPSFEHPPVHSKVAATSSGSSNSYGDAQLLCRRLCTPMLASVFSEIVNIWFKERWLVFAENQQETFLILDADITGRLTVQKAIDQNSFVNTQHYLLALPDCLLFRTEPHNRSLFLPNTTISFDHLLHKKLRSNDHSSRGQLVAILCKSAENSGRFMFYKHLQRNAWYIYFNDPVTSAKSYSHMLSQEEQGQLESATERNSQNHADHASQLAFPLSALTNHPITYVYLPRKSDW